jgi:ABC-type bacteriocin/lantibiotic exporter with double-glycine peptidase domain
MFKGLKKILSDLKQLSINEFKGEQVKDFFASHGLNILLILFIIFAFFYVFSKVISVVFKLMIVVIILVAIFILVFKRDKIKDFFNSKKQETNLEGKKK